MGVATTNCEYDAKLKVWQRIRDVLAGQDAIHKAGLKYLPELSEQDDDEYKAYLFRALFFNATSRVADTLSGLVFRKPPALQVEPIKDMAASCGLWFISRLNSRSGDDGTYASVSLGSLVQRGSTAPIAAVRKRSA